MDENRARELLKTERASVEELLRGAEAAGRSDREAGGAHDGSSDAAELLAGQNTDDELAAGLRDRLAASHPKGYDRLSVLGRISKRPLADLTRRASLASIHRSDGLVRV